jgi:hypothetical protein
MNLSRKTTVTLAATLTGVLGMAGVAAAARGSADEVRREDRPARTTTSVTTGAAITRTSEVEVEHPRREPNVDNGVDPIGHDVNHDRGVDPAGHDVNDVRGVDPAGHDVNDDRGDDVTTPTATATVDVTTTTVEDHAEPRDDAPGLDANDDHRGPGRGGDDGDGGRGNGGSDGD